MSADAVGVSAAPGPETIMRGDQPLSRAVKRSAVPSATKRPVSRRALRISSERMSLTLSF
jgi:hypothetical protein